MVPVKDNRSGDKPEENKVILSLCIWDMVQLISFLHLYRFDAPDATDMNDSFTAFQKEFWTKVKTKVATGDSYKRYDIHITPFQALTILAFLRQDDVDLEDQEIFSKAAVENYEIAIRSAIKGPQIDEAFAEKFAKKCIAINKD